MHARDEIEIAVQVGALLGEVPRDEAHHTVVGLLREVTDADAALLVSCDLTGRRHQQLATSGYPADVAWHAVNTFPHTRWWRTVVNAPLPPGISASPEEDFREGAYYRNHVGPAGFKDGLSLALQDGAQTVGMLHLSSFGDSHFTRRHQELLAGVSKALSRLVCDDHPGCARCRPADMMPLASIRGGVVANSSQAPPELVEDVDLAAVIRQVEDLRHHPAWTFTWPKGRTWFRVRVDSQERGVEARVRSGRRAFGLTVRELEVLTALATGASNDMIAEDLIVSPRTVHTHVEHLLAKLCAANRTQAACAAVRDGLLLPAADPSRLSSVAALLGTGSSLTTRRSRDVARSP